MKAKEPGPSGLLVVDKQPGMTSHDVVARARRVLRTREVGHTGTLDPFATGVLVLGVGEALKVAAHLTEQDKEYEAVIALGAETDSLDLTGAVIRTAPLPELGTTDAPSAGLREALVAEAARTSQVPPAASAIHIDGERAHERLRRGETLVMPERPVAVRSLQLLAVEAPDRLRVRVHAAKGYYVRALARDLADRLGTAGHLVELRRLRSGLFTIAEAGPVEGPLVSLNDALRRLFPSREIADPDRVQAMRHGKRIDVADLDLPADTTFVAFDATGAPIALARREADLIVVQRGFR
ncbi:MAG: tRNA pseudouridine(55) synthase TruB [Myxococcales bacterium]|nr:MAG: tRNA pseudouridine(55) synthase TruB [Myxococcales bacterium]